MRITVRILYIPMTSCMVWISTYLPHTTDDKILDWLVLGYRRGDDTKNTLKNVLTIDSSKSRPPFTDAEVQVQVGRLSKFEYEYIRPQSIHKRIYL